MQSALVLGHDSRSALAVIRSLGESGIKVDLGTFSKSTLCKYSRYAKRIHLLPNPFENAAKMVSCLSHLLPQKDYSLVIPTSDEYLVPIMRNLEHFHSINSFAIPASNVFKLANEKKETLRIARENKVPYPHSITITNPSEITSHLTNLSYPTIVKPNSSKVLIRDQLVSMKVHQAESENQLVTILEEITRFVPVLVQEYISGIGIGQEFLSNNGKIVAAFQHERVHEPERGGGSSYRRSAKLDYDLFTYSKRIIQALNWSGVIMVEYKWNPEIDEKYLMEVNGRFWGSLPLAIHSGVDFPRLLFDSIVNRRKVSPPKYKIGVYCRNPILDLKWIVSHWRRKSGNFRFGDFLKEVQDGFRKIIHRIEHLDTFTAGDFAPGIMEFIHFFNSQVHSYFSKRKKRKFSEMYSIMKAEGYELRAKIVERIIENPHILFICYGNIFRSPYAEATLRSLLRKDGLEEFNIKSAGLLESEGRAVPGSAQNIGRQEGIDLSTHRSRLLDFSMVDWSGIILVMDSRNLHAVTSKFPQARDKTFLIGLFNNEDESHEIDDPWDLDSQKLLSIYAKIRRSCLNLEEMLLEAVS